MLRKEGQNVLDSDTERQTPQAQGSHASLVIGLFLHLFYCSVCERVTLWMEMRMAPQGSAIWHLLLGALRRGIVKPGHWSPRTIGWPRVAWPTSRRELTEVQHWHVLPLAWVGPSWKILHIHKRSKGSGYPGHRVVLGWRAPITGSGCEKMAMRRGGLSTGRHNSLVGGGGLLAALASWKGPAQRVFCWPQHGSHVTHVNIRSHPNHLLTAFGAVHCEFTWEACQEMFQAEVCSAQIGTGWLRECNAQHAQQNLLSTWYAHMITALLQDPFLLLTL
mmetsp:Transcript_36823/g.68569  ORF Transcript_36823/g.68569 Transcript_36823/m.68569 type:complete len:276 (-) Transcript_36823:829-1656(-)